MSKPEKLQQLRAEIDAIDNRMHDLLRARADIVHRVRAVKGKQALFIRPGREATMLYALLARKQGKIPPGLITSLWRAMIGAFTMQEGALRVAVTVGTGKADLWDLTRDFYGCVTPLFPHATPDRTLRALIAGKAEVAIMPLPARHDPQPWWRLLAQHPDLRIFARLPFDLRDMPRNNGRGNKTGALAVARINPEATGDDHGLILARVKNRATAASSRAALKKHLHPIAITGAPDQEYWLITRRGLVNHDADFLHPEYCRTHYPGITLHDCGGYALPIAAVPGVRTK